MKLFEEKERTDTNPAKHLDNTFSFYDRSALKFAYQVRTMLNCWFENYPITEKSELKSRFLKSFSPAFYELFLHELFLRQGFELLPHPLIEGSSKRPDFLVKGKGIEFYLEAKESTDKSDSERSEENRIKQFYDTLSSLKTPIYFLHLQELILKTANPLKGKKIANYIESQLSKFDPDVIEARIRETGLRAPADIIYEDEDLKLSLSLIPKSPEIRDKDGIRPIGIYPFIATWGGSSESIKSAFEKKATRYGNLDKPYLICINTTSERHTDDYEVMEVLFGQLQVAISNDTNNPTQTWKREPNGVFLDKTGPKNRRVSGVLITDIHPTTMEIARHWLVKNPFASKDLDLDTFVITQQSSEESNESIPKSKSIKEIFDIPDNWLNLE